MARHLAGLGVGGRLPEMGAPRNPEVPGGTEGTGPSVRGELPEGLLTGIAWSGDGHDGHLRVVIGAGALEGATLFVRAQGGRLQVELTVPPGVDGARWRKRLQERLRARNLPVDEVDVL